ncbi:MAG: hypothetical protein AAGG48_16675 [Planctomycetota bacterium]
MDPKSFVASLVLVCGFAGTSSILGLLPMRYTRELFGSSRPSFNLIDLFSLGAIQVACFGYIWTIRVDADDMERFTFALGVGCVATFWWLFIAARLTHTALESLARGVYLCFFVTAAFVCPIIMVLSVIDKILPFDERPGLNFETDFTRALIALVVYAACFPINRWLARRLTTATGDH